MHQETISDIASLQDRIGQEVCVSDWIKVTQERIDLFARATDDHQWIHTDPERCRTESPFGKTIAHGFLIASMIAYLSEASINFAQNFQLTINSGMNKLRFLQPVPVDSEIRMRMVPNQVKKVRETWKILWGITLDIKGQKKPACQVEMVVRYIIEMPTRGAGAEAAGGAVGGNE